MLSYGPRFVTRPAEMGAERRKVLISFSRDMADWADRAANRIETIAGQLRDRDFDVVFWHRLEPERANAAEGWADYIVSTSDPTMELVIVLLGERIGQPTPVGFGEAARMAARLKAAGYDWIKVQGPDADFQTVYEKPESNVPLTGTLQEYLDAVLNARVSRRDNGYNAGSEIPLKVAAPER